MSAPDSVAADGAPKARPSPRSLARRSLAGLILLVALVTAHQASSSGRSNAGIRCSSSSSGWGRWH